MSEMYRPAGGVELHNYFYTSRVFLRGNLNSPRVNQNLQLASLVGSILINSRLVLRHPLVHNSCREIKDAARFARTHLFSSARVLYNEKRLEVWKYL